MVLYHRPTATSVPPPQILDRQNRQRKRRKVAVAPIPQDIVAVDDKKGTLKPTTKDKAKEKGKIVTKSRDTKRPSITNGKTITTTTRTTTATATATTTTVAIPIPTPPKPNHTLHVKIDMMLQSAPEEKDVTASLPSIVEGRWVSVIGYKLPDGALKGIAMIEVDNKGLDLEAYERAVVGMVAVREGLERKVFEGTARGCAVGTGDWGY
ncbi:hypothetical protein AA313_de0207446 [Arthrobotrys entomopaga]|nr:hypothetical protein AA313_de0207446 [Arthrobotrys entomopaga]